MAACLGRMLPDGGERPPDHLDALRPVWDFCQSTDVAAQSAHEARADAGAWQQEARANNVFPLDHRFAPDRGRSRAAAEVPRAASISTSGART